MALTNVDGHYKATLDQLSESVRASMAVEHLLEDPALSQQKTRAVNEIAQQYEVSATSVHKLMRIKLEHPTSFTAILQGKDKLTAVYSKYFESKN